MLSTRTLELTLQTASRPKPSFPSSEVSLCDTDGKRIILGSFRGLLDIITAESHIKLDLKHDSAVTCATIDSDIVLIGFLSGAIRAFRLGSGTIYAPLFEHHLSSPCSDIIVIDSQTSYLAFSLSGTMSSFNKDVISVTRQVADCGITRAVALATNSPSIIAGTSQGHLITLNLDGSTKCKWHAHTSHVTSIAVISEKEVASLSQEGEVILSDYVRGTGLITVRQPESVFPARYMLLDKVERESERGNAPDDTKQLDQTSTHQVRLLALDFHSLVPTYAEITEAQDRVRETSRMQLVDLCCRSGKAKAVKGRKKK